MSERSFRRENQRRAAAAQRREQRRARRVATTAVAAGAFALAAPAASQAANIEVANNTDADPGSLRAAIITSNTNGEDDQITFNASLTGQTITLTSGPLSIGGDGSYDLTITGLGEDQLYIDGNDNSAVIYNNADGDVDISGVTIQGGHGGATGGIFNTGSYMKLSDSTVTGNVAEGSNPNPDVYYGGGGITNAGRMLISDSSVLGNTSNAQDGFPYGPPYGGGGIQNAGAMTINSSEISGNSAANMGGGLFEGGTKYRPSLNMNDTLIYDNGAPIGGGVSGFSLDFFGDTVPT